MKQKNIYSCGDHNDCLGPIIFITDLKITFYYSKTFEKSHRGWSNKIELNKRDKRTYGCKNSAKYCLNKHIWTSCCINIILRPLCWQNNSNNNKSCSKSLNCYILSYCYSFRFQKKFKKKTFDSRLTTNVLAKYNQNQECMLISRLYYRRNLAITSSIPPLKVRQYI